MACAARRRVSGCAVVSDLLARIESEAAASADGRGVLLLTPPEVHDVLRRCAVRLDEECVVAIGIVLQLADGSTGTAWATGPTGDVAHLTHALGRLQYRIYKQGDPLPDEVSE